jgi:hypothetical protein
LTLKKNAGMPENFRFILGYAYQEKKKKIYQQKYKVFGLIPAAF